MELEANNGGVHGDCGELVKTLKEKGNQIDNLVEACRGILESLDRDTGSMKAVSIIVHQLF